MSFVAGDIEQVMQAWLDNRLKNGDLTMPGCNKDKRHGARRHLCRLQTAKTRE